MSKRTSNLISAAIQTQREWLKGADVFQRDALQYIEKALRMDGLVSLTLLSAWVSSLGLLYGTRGLIAVLDNESVGWSDLAGAVESYLWAVRLETRCHYSWEVPERKKRGTFLRGTLPLAVCLLAHFTGSGELRREREVWALLQKPLRSDDPNTGRWWYERYFEPFFVTLYANAHGEPPPLDRSRLDLGVYRCILESWQDDAAVAGSLRVACDYHLLNIENTRDWDAEFRQTPFDLVPVEIHAVNQLRKITGLKPMEVDHPLMHALPPATLATPPPELMETLSQVEDKYREFYPKDVLA